MSNTQKPPFKNKGGRLDRFPRNKWGCVVSWQSKVPLSVRFYCLLFRNNYFFKRIKVAIQCFPAGIVNEQKWRVLLWAKNKKGMSVFPTICPLLLQQLSRERSYLFFQLIMIFFFTLFKREHLKEALCSAWSLMGNPTWGSIPWPWDYDLSRNQRVRGSNDWATQAPQEGLHL